MSHQIPWLRIAAEGAAIVVSILLAFAIEAWWSGQEDRSDVITSLELLVGDLATTRAELDEFLGETESRMQLAASVSEALAGPVATVDRGAVSSDLSQMFWRRTVDFSSAAFTDLIRVGYMALGATANR